MINKIKEFIGKIFNRRSKKGEVVILTDLEYGREYAEYLTKYAVEKYKDCLINLAKK